ncbi:MAG: hypothetical protein EXS29_06290 [Pedosphaera sp.]|nr:hypothetical protein [Pedosphaera sp.]
MNRLLFAMGLLSILFGAKAPAFAAEMVIPLDLAKFSCGGTVLGERPKDGELYAKHFDRGGIAKFEKSGVELETKDGVLDYAFITVANFKGTLLKSGQRLSITAQTSIEEIVALFGEPYWKDAQDDEVILFYEFLGGKIELQFEFPDKRRLGFITLARDGVLSKADQRKAYGVTKPWPPK